MRVERLALSRLLAATTKVVEGRNTIPILSTVRLVADGDVLTVTATDLDIEVQGTVKCDDDFSACVDAKLLGDIVKRAAGSEVELVASGGFVTIKSGRYSSRLPTPPVEDFPEFTADGWTATFDVDLAALFAPVKFSISTEETRYYLNGIYLCGTPTELVAVATDGHRLSRNHGDPVGEFGGVIVPRKTAGLVPTGVVSVSLSDRKIRFTAPDGTVITSKLIDSTFPDYQRVIPTNNDKLVTFNSADMAKAVARVSVIASERGRAVRMAFAGDTATLSVSSADNGSATEELAVAYAGDHVEIGFNAQYVADCLGAFSAGEVTLALNDGGSPALMSSEKAPGLVVVLMPMRV